MKKCPLRLQHQHSWKTAYAVFGFSRSLRDFRNLGLRQLFNGLRVPKLMTGTDHESQPARVCLEVYKKPDETSEQVATLQVNDKICVLSFGDWAHVHWRRGETFDGWVHHMGAQTEAKPY